MSLKEQAKEKRNSYSHILLGYIFKTPDLMNFLQMRNLQITYSMKSIFPIISAFI